MTSLDAASSTSPDSIIFADPAHSFYPRPIISDILRTDFCVPHSVLLVENIDIIPLPPAGSASSSHRRRSAYKWRTIRLMLGDGELCIQALLPISMHRFVDMGEVAVGTYVRLPRFELHRKPLKDLAQVHDTMVYLIVWDMVSVGWNKAFLGRPATATAAAQLAEAEGEQSEQLELDEELQQQLRREQEPLHGPDKPSTTPPLDNNDNLDVIPDIDDWSDANDGFATDNDNDDDDDFEVMLVPLPPKSTTTTNDNDVTAQPGQASTTKTTPAPNPAATQHAAPLKPIAMARDWRNPLHPLKLTTLQALPHLPYKQNWSINVLAIVTWLSAVEASPFPPHRQRFARLADPSLPQDRRVHLTVFLDADAFTPTVGKPVLLAGVKNHAFEGGSLKKYASDRLANDMSWWFEEPRALGWCDVDGLAAWWASQPKPGQEDDAV